MMKPRGISNSWKPLSPQGLKGRRGRDWPRQETAGARRGSEGQNTALQQGREVGVGELNTLFSLLPLLHSLGSHHWLPRAKTNWKPEDRDAWMTQPIEVSLVRGTWRPASPCSERLNNLTKSFGLKFKPWSSWIQSTTLLSSHCRHYQEEQLEIGRKDRQGNEISTCRPVLSKV